MLLHIPDLNQQQLHFHYVQQDDNNQPKDDTKILDQKVSNNNLFDGAFDAMNRDHEDDEWYEETYIYSYLSNTISNTPADWGCIQPDFTSLKLFLKPAEIEACSL